MKNCISILSLTFALFSLTSCDVLQQAAKDVKIPQIPTDLPLTNEEVIKGLKSALSVGTDTSVSRLSKLNGYLNDALIKLALPPEAQPILNNISKIPGGSKLIADAIIAINRAAEDAAPQAKQIFINAITGITIADGFQILKGSNTAATDYLKGKTFQDLTNAFAPRIQTSLSKPLVMNVSAESAYSQLINAYNKASLNGVLFAQVKQNSLASYTTQKALEGLFLKVADEEKKIRENASHRVNDILRRVFGKS